jgi:hypothetical protein
MSAGQAAFDKALTDSTAPSCDKNGLVCFRPRTAGANLHRPQNTKDFVTYYWPNAS